MEEGFEIIEHTADYGLKVRAKTVEGIFEQTAKGMYSLITNPDKVETKRSIEIELKGDDIESLLVDFINELLFYTETEGFLLKDLNVSLNGNNLKALCRGENFDSERHEIVEAVKAATYHMLKIERKNEGLEATIIFDV